MSANRFSLQGRRALVTGANSGIGRAIAIGLAEHGTKIILHHFGDANGAAKTANDIGHATPILEADFTNTAAAATLADNVLSKHGPIDILIANAAIERRLPWRDAVPAHVEAHVAANFTSTITLIRKLVPVMAERGWGRVVATGSVMATRPRAETVVYASIKAAQLTAIRAIGREVAARGVTMNVVSPGAIETEATTQRYADAAFRRAVVAKIPVGRQGRPDDLVGAFVFLCSDAASYVTGANISVDGGWTIGDPPGMLPGEAA
jgi:NAD(P)-dependent dehydrogenase (short-subunit alcohol dehydrogenase family)